LVPSVKLKPVSGVDDSKAQQLFPGYILVEMEMKPELLRLVMVSLRVVKFLGGENPESLSLKEVERIVTQVKTGVTIDVKKEKFDIGSEVDIQEGPFSGFVGVIDRVDEENEKLTVMVSIFGRMTPIDFSFNQVKR